MGVLGCVENVFHPEIPAGAIAVTLGAAAD
jgi:hypothetical protein